MPSTRPTEREVKRWIQAELIGRNYVDQDQLNEVRRQDADWIMTYIRTQIAAHIAIQHMPLLARALRRARGMLHSRFPHRFGPAS